MRRWLIGWAVLASVGPAAAQNSSNNRTPTDCSISLTTGGTAQNIIAATTGVSGFQIQNIDTSEPLWVSFTGTAVAGAAGSFAIPAATASTFAGAGSYYSAYGFNKAVSVVAATTAHKISCTRW